jgi:hypothetical protein
MLVILVVILVILVMWVWLGLEHWSQGFGSRYW